MKSAVSVVAVVVLLGGCASSSTMSSGPDVRVHLDQVAGPPDVYYFAGPVNIQYRVSIENPTDEPLTLTRLDLQTLGPGAYSLRTEATPMKQRLCQRSVRAQIWAAQGGDDGIYSSVVWQEESPVVCPVCGGR